MLFQVEKHSKMTFAGRKELMTLISKIAWPAADSRVAHWKSGVAPRLARSRYTPATTRIHVTLLTMRIGKSAASLRKP